MTKKYNFNDGFKLKPISTYNLSIYRVCLDRTYFAEMKIEN